VVRLCALEGVSAGAGYAQRLVRASIPPSSLCVQAEGRAKWRGLLGQEGVRSHANSPGGRGVAPQRRCQGKLGSWTQWKAAIYVHSFGRQHYKAEKGVLD